LGSPDNAVIIINNCYHSEILENNVQLCLYSFYLVDFLNKH